RPGPPELTAAHKRLIPEFLWHGAEAYGFHGEVWTTARIAQVIAEEFGVRYHKDHVGKLLKELRWTPQVPIKRAIQRAEVAIRRWREEVWPDLQRRARRERRVLVFEDESGFNSRQPPIPSLLGESGVRDLQEGHALINEEKVSDFPRSSGRASPDLWEG